MHYLIHAADTPELAPEGLQAARRYAFVPQFEILIVILRFAVLVVGLSLHYDFFGVVVAQTVVQVGLGIGPALWVMVRELGHVPHFRGATRADYASLLHISFYMFLIHLSVVLADKVDTTILGFMRSLISKMVTASFPGGERICFASLSQKTLLSIPMITN